jgi:hypothetical protein
LFILPVLTHKVRQHHRLSIHHWCCHWPLVMVMVEDVAVVVVVLLLQ